MLRLYYHPDELEAAIHSVRKNLHNPKFDEACCSRMLIDKVMELINTNKDKVSNDQDLIDHVYYHGVYIFLFNANTIRFIIPDPHKEYYITIDLADVVYKEIKKTNDERTIKEIIE